MEIPLNAPVVYISFSAEINPATTESLLSVLANCANRQVQSVYLMLSTPGGSVMNGMNIYNVMKGMPFELTIHNVGNVDSIGNAIFLAGKKRYATDNATFMFHGVGLTQDGSRRLEEKFLRECLDNILHDQQRIGKVISSNTNITTIEVGELFREARTKNVSYAIDKGIIHEIKDVEIAAGAPVITLVFRR